MKISKISISLPESMRLFVEDQTEVTGRCSVSEYIRELIRKEQVRAAERLDAYEHSLQVRREMRQTSDNSGHRRY